MSNVTWQKEGKPKSDDVLCVVWVRDDYEFAFWLSEPGFWNSPDAGWIAEEEVEGWAALS